MNNNDFKIIYKKPTDYENLSSSTKSSNLSDSDNESLKLYVKNNFDKDFQINHENINYNIDEPIQISLSDLVDIDIDNLILKLDKLEEKDEIKKVITEYLDYKKYSEQDKNFVLLKLKNKINMLNSTDQLIQSDVSIQQTNEINQQFKKEESLIDYDSSKWLAISATIITIIIVIIIFIKYYKNTK